MDSQDDGDLNLLTIAQEYADEDKARELLERLRWPDGPVSPLKITWVPAQCANGPVPVDAVVPGVRAVVGVT